RNVSELILGKSLRSRWSELWRGSPVNDVIHHSGNIDVRVISADAGEVRIAPRVRRAVPETSYLAAAVLVVAAGFIGKGLQLELALPDPAMVFLTGVLLTAVVGGLGPSIMAAVSSLLVYDFFFVEPLYTFTVTKPNDILSLLVFLVVALLTSNLTARIRDQAEAARRREERTAALYAFSRQLAAAVGIDDLLPTVVAHVAEQFSAQVVVLLPEGGRLG